MAGPDDAAHHHDHSKKKLKFLFKRPSPINTWGEQTLRGETWIELFMDLFYVAFLLKLGDLFHSCGFNTPSVVYSASVFLGVYMAKFHLDQYINKFGTEDLVHKVFFTLYSAGLFIMTLSVNDTAEQGVDADGGSGHRLLASSSSNKIQHFDCPEYRPYIIGFTVGWLITRGTILLMFCSILYFVKPQGKFVFYAKAPIIVVSMVIMMGNFLVSDYHHYYHSYFTMAAGLVEYLGWGIWEVIIFGTWLIENHGLKAMIPVNIHHHSARTSAFLMIVLGEAIIALLTPLLHPEVHVWTYTLLGFLLIFTLAILYFDTNPTHHEPHALSISRISGTVWVLAHPFLAFFLFGVGTALKLTYEDLREDLHRVTNQQILGIFLGLSIFTMTLIRVCHKARLTIGGTITVMTRFIIAGLHVVVGFILSDNDSNDFSDEAKLMIHCFLNFVLLALDIYKYRELDREEHLKKQEIMNRVASVRMQPNQGETQTTSSAPDRSSLTRQFLSSTLISMPYAEKNDRYKKRHSLRSVSSMQSRQSVNSETNGRQQQRRHSTNFFALSPDQQISSIAPRGESKSTNGNGSTAAPPSSVLGDSVVEMILDPSSESNLDYPLPETTPSVVSVDVPSISSLEKFRDNTYRRSKSLTLSEDGAGPPSMKPPVLRRHSTVDNQRGKGLRDDSTYHINEDGQMFVRKGTCGLIPARSVRKTADKTRPIPPLALTQPPLPSEADVSEANTFVELSSVQTSEYGGIEIVEGEEEYSDDEELEIIYDDSATASHVTWL